MNKKYIEFLKNAQELNINFEIIPLLYGSLGLEVLTNTSLNSDEHTCRKNGIDYSYASIENLKEFADINIKEIPNYKNNNSKFLLLTLEQYLKVYKKSAQDGYRVNKKEKQDDKKIKFIEEKLQKNNLNI